MCSEWRNQETAGSDWAELLLPYSTWRRSTDISGKKKTYLKCLKPLCSLTVNYSIIVRVVENDIRYSICLECFSGSSEADSDLLRTAMLSQLAWLAFFPYFSFFIYQLITERKTFYLAADSPNILEEWIRILQSIIKVQSSGPLVMETTAKPTVRGWLTKVKRQDTSQPTLFWVFPFLLLVLVSACPKL